MKRSDIIINMNDAEEHESLAGEFYGGFDKYLTTMPRIGHLGVVRVRLPSGRAGCPFHTHQVDDEVFIILEGRGTLRYGEESFPIAAGDCISCAAGTGLAHQIANTGDSDLVYLAIGGDDPNEVCTYPDSGKVMVRSVKTVGKLTKTDYFADEPMPPKVF